MKKLTTQTLFTLILLNLGFACGVKTPPRVSPIQQDLYVDSTHVKVTRHPNGDIDSTGYKHDKIMFKYRNGKLVKYPNQL